jgi:hypothetical protein
MLFRKNTNLKVSIPSQEVSPVAAVSVTCEATILESISNGEAKWIAKNKKLIF